MRCQKRASNLPCRSDVVVTLIASCPPPRSTFAPLVEHIFYRSEGERRTHVRHVRRKCGAIERGLGRECLENGERLGVVYARSLVFAARDEVGPVR